MTADTSSANGPMCLHGRGRGCVRCGRGELARVDLDGGYVGVRGGALAPRRHRVGAVEARRLATRQRGRRGVAVERLVAVVLDREAHRRVRTAHAAVSGRRLAGQRWQLALGLRRLWHR